AEAENHGHRTNRQDEELDKKAIGVGLKMDRLLESQIRRGMYERDEEKDDRAKSDNGDQDDEEPNRRYGITDSADPYIDNASQSALTLDGGLVNAQSGRHVFLQHRHISQTTED